MYSALSVNAPTAYTTQSPPWEVCVARRWSHEYPVGFGEYDRRHGYAILEEALADGWEPFGATPDPTGASASLIWLRRPRPPERRWLTPENTVVKTT